MMPEMEKDPEVQRWLEREREEYQEKAQYFERLLSAEVHWFFVQGLQAIRSNLYIPGVCSLLNGIEASLRVTIAQVTAGGGIEELSPYSVLSNTLIRSGQHLGMPVEALAFPGETDFLAKLATEKPNRIDVEVVRQRNNLCHGNVFEYINRELGPDIALFTPECLRELAEVLLGVSDRWTEALGQFRTSKWLTRV
jgi:hypothetical protein